MAEGRLSDFVTGMGAAMADTVYGFIAGFGLHIKFCTFDTLFVKNGFGFNETPAS